MRFFPLFLVFYVTLILSSRFAFARDVTVSVSVTVDGAEAQSAQSAHTTHRPHHHARSHLLDVPHHEEWTEDDESGDFNKVYPIHPDTLKPLPEEEMNVPEHAAFLVAEMADSVELNDAMAAASQQKADEFMTELHNVLPKADPAVVESFHPYFFMQIADKQNAKCRGFLSSNGRKAFYDGACLPSHLCARGTPLNDVNPTTQKADCSNGLYTLQCCYPDSDRLNVVPVTSSEWQDRFVRYSAVQNKKYKTKAEYSRRLKIFRENAARVAAHNRSPQARFYTLTLTSLAEKSPDEVLVKFNKPKKDASERAMFLLPVSPQERIANLFDGTEKLQFKNFDGTQPNDMFNSRDQSMIASTTPSKVSDGSRSARRLLQVKPKKRTTPAVKPKPKPKRTVTPPKPKIDLTIYPECQVFKLNGTGRCAPDYEVCYHAGGTSTFTPDCANPRACCLSFAQLNQMRENPFFPPWTPAPEIDWRNTDKLTPAKNQASCGSCFVHSATDTLEAWAAIYEKRPAVSLSVQQFMSCSNPEKDHCKGGWPADVMSWYAKNGAQTMDDFPYEAGDGEYPRTSDKCALDKKVQPWVKLTNYRYQSNIGVISLKNEDEIYEALNHGPVSFAMGAGADLTLFENGIYNPSTCPTGSGHAMTIVGAGATAEGLKYWIVKNSWGKSFGANGYFRIVRGIGICRLGSWGQWIPKFDYEKEGAQCKVGNKAGVGVCMESMVCETKGDDWRTTIRKSCQKGFNWGVCCSHKDEVTKALQNGGIMTD